MTGPGTQEERSYRRIDQSAEDRRSTPEVLAGILLSLFERTAGPVLIAVGGPGGTGKSTFCARLAGRLPEARILELDHYKSPIRIRSEQGISGPDPRANKMVLLKSHLRLIKQGRPFLAPVQLPGWGDVRRVERYDPARFNLLDGEVSTYPDFQEEIDFSIFIDSDIEVQLRSRLERDTQVRGLSMQQAADTFLRSNLLEFSEFGAATKATADVHLRCREDYHHDLEAVAAEHFPLGEHLGLWREPVQ